MNLDLMSVEYQQNPFPYHHKLREECPVSWSESLEAWCIADYDDIVTVLSDSARFSSAKFWPQLLGEFDPVPEALPMISMDPPKHLRTRMLAQKAFLPRELGKLADRIEVIADELIDQAIAKSDANEFDFAQDFAALFPTSVIAEMLGIEKGMREDFKRWINDLVSAPNRAIYSDEKLSQIRRSIDDMRSYFIKIVDERTENPGDDMISLFITAEVDGERLSKGEVLSLSVLLLLGGTETTSNLLGNLMAGFHEHPEDFALVRAERSKVPELLEEQLRLTSPVQALFRHTTQEVELSGVTIPANALVVAMLQCANRDPEKFEYPDDFELGRDTRRSCTFGQGPHFCMGNYLTKMEAAIAVNKLFDRFKVLEPLQKFEDIEWIDSFVARGPVTLPVRYELA